MILESERFDTHEQIIDGLGRIENKHDLDVFERGIYMTKLGQMYGKLLLNYTRLVVEAYGRIEI